MRTPFIAGNWKMNSTSVEAKSLVTGMLPELEKLSSIERVICPPATSLCIVSELLKGTQVFVGAQNMHWENSGAYTGEISPLMVKEFCKYVILGHSERRTLFGETDEIVNKKTSAALSHGLIPIVCIGETLVEKETNQTPDVIVRQITKGLNSIPSPVENLVIAYEPVWAIGTGKASTPDDASFVISKWIRPTLSKMFGAEAAQTIRVLYGGSVKAENATNFFNEEQIDGALVGGASLKVNEFLPIAVAAEKSTRN